MLSSIDPRALLRLWEMCWNSRLRDCIAADVALMLSTHPFTPSTSLPRTVTFACEALEEPKDRMDWVLPGDHTLRMTLSFDDIGAWYGCSLTHFRLRKRRYLLWSRRLQQARRLHPCVRTEEERRT